MDHLICHISSQADKLKYEFTAVLVCFQEVYSARRKEGTLKSVLKSSEYMLFTNSVNHLCLILCSHWDTE